MTKIVTSAAVLRLCEEGLADLDASLAELGPPELRAGIHVLVGIAVRTSPPRRFVPRGVIAEAAANAPRVDAERFRADVDGIVEQSVDA